MLGVGKAGPALPFCPTESSEFQQKSRRPHQTQEKVDSGESSGQAIAHSHFSVALSGSLLFKFVKIKPVIQSERYPRRLLSRGGGGGLVPSLTTPVLELATFDMTVSVDETVSMLPGDGQVLLAARH